MPMIIWKCCNHIKILKKRERERELKQCFGSHNVISPRHQQHIVEKNKNVCHSDIIMKTTCTFTCIIY